MLRFVVRRLLQVIPTLLVLSVLAFAWWRALPGGPAAALLGDRATPERTAELDRALGLDQPLPGQYGQFVGRVLTGDFGTSTITGEPVVAEIGRALPATVELSVAAMLVAVLVGVPLGYVAAQRHRGPVDVVARVVGLLGVVAPVFVLAVALRSSLAVQLGWFPPSGRQAATVDATSVTGFAVLDGLLTREFHASLDALGHLVLPALALAAVPLAVIVSSTRASVLDVLGSDFVRTAHARGLAPRTVRSRHVLRNALVPVTTTVGLRVGLLLGGVVLVEKVFGWGGVGALLAEGVAVRDYPRLLAVPLLGALACVVVKLLADLSSAFADPRVRQVA